MDDGMDDLFASDQSINKQLVYFLSAVPIWMKLIHTNASKVIQRAMLRIGIGVFQFVHKSSSRMLNVSLPPSAIRIGYVLLATEPGDMIRNEWSCHFAKPVYNVPCGEGYVPHSMSCVCIQTDRHADKHRFFCTYYVWCVWNSPESVCEDGGAAAAAADFAHV